MKKILIGCVVCNKLEVVSPPDLLSERMSEDPPFSHTGIDLPDHYSPRTMVNWTRPTF